MLAAARCTRHNRPIMWQKRPANADAVMHCACGSALHCVLWQHHMHVSHHHMAASYAYVTSLHGSALHCAFWGLYLECRIGEERGRKRRREQMGGKARDGRGEAETEEERPWEAREEEMRG